MSVAQEVYNLLFERFGPQAWWPGDSPLEVLAGAVLVQNTNWNNAAKAIACLKEAGLLHLPALSKCSAAELESALKPAGTFRVKAKRLKNLVAMIMDRYGGDLNTMFAESTANLREALLSTSGIGPETADCILLYAGEHASFVVDSYTYRVLFRHGWIEEQADYHEIQDWFQRQLPLDAPLFNEYHALLVKLGKEYCKTQPVCDGCPLACLLPESGARQHEAFD